MKIAPKFPRLLTICVLTITLPLAALAEPMGKGEPHADKCAPHSPMGMKGPMQEMPPYLKGIQLTETQMDKIFEITHPQVPVMRNLSKQRHQLMAELHQATIATPFDEAKIRKIADKLADVEKKILLQRTLTDAKIFAILSPEQRAEVQQKMNQPHGPSLHKPTGFRPGHHKASPQVRS